MKKTVIGFALMVFAGLAMAQLPSVDPQVVCNYLEVEQLPTQGWQVDEQQQGRCVSTIRGFGRESVGPLHQLSYEARGDATTAAILQVILDVNPPQAMSNANQAFNQASRRLVTTVLGKTPPAAITSAITQGREATAVVGNSTLTVSRREHETGTGYQMRFSIE